MTAQDRENVLVVSKEAYGLRPPLDVPENVEFLDGIEALIEGARVEEYAHGVHDGEGFIRYIGHQNAQMQRLIAALIRSRRIDRAVIQAATSNLEADLRYSGWAPSEDFIKATELEAHDILQFMAEAERTAREENHDE